MVNNVDNITKNLLLDSAVDKFRQNNNTIFSSEKYIKSHYTPSLSVLKRYGITWDAIVKKAMSENMKFNSGAMANRYDYNSIHIDNLKKAYKLKTIPLCNDDFVKRRFGLYSLSSFKIRGNNPRKMCELANVPYVHLSSYKLEHKIKTQKIKTVNYQPSSDTVKNDILDSIKVAYDLKKESLKCSDFKNGLYGLPKIDKCRSYFFNLKAACDSVSVPYKSFNTCKLTYTKEALIDNISSAYKTKGSKLQCTDFIYRKYGLLAHSLFERNFQSFKNACLVANVPYTSYQNSSAPYSENEVAEHMKNAIAVLNRPLVTSDFDDKTIRSKFSLPSRMFINSKGRTLHKFCKKYGIQYARDKKITQDIDKTISSQDRAWITRRKSKEYAIKPIKTVDYNSETKNLIRKAIIDYMEGYVVLGGTVLVLESAQRLLITALKHSKIWNAVDSILIPNCKENIKVMEDEKIKIKLFLNTYLSAVLKIGLKLNAAWFDYCCHPETAMKDIEKAFANHCFSDRAVMFMTFSTRTSNPIKREKVSDPNYLVHYDAMVQNFAEHYGYKAKTLDVFGPHPGSSGTKAMFTLGFEVTKL